MFKTVGVDTVLYYCLLILAFSVTLGIFGRYDWKLDLLAHWRFHYVLMGCILILLLLSRKHYRNAIAAGLVVWLNAILLDYPRQAFAQESDIQVNKSLSKLRLVAFNVLCTNRSYGPTLQWFRAVDPDFVVLIELTDGWSNAMKSLKATLPHTVEVADNEGSGIAVFSRFKINKSSVLYLGEKRRPVVIAAVAVDEQEMTIFAAHPWPPTTWSKARDRDQYLSELGSLIGQVHTPVILAGDLNTTPWSYAFEDFVRSAGLSSKQFAPTWPATLGPLGIPLDHVLGKAVHINRLRVGPVLESDHLPVIVEITAANRNPGAP